MDFATPEAKNAAILKTESPLEGRRLLIKDGARVLFFPRIVRLLNNSTGGNFEGRPVKPGVSLDDPGARGKGQSKFAQKVLSAQKQPPAPTLFIGNLGFETTTESIKGLLDAHRAKEKKKKSETVRVASSESADNINNDDDDVAPKKDPWIRKIRMGTFEDSGLCKGYVLYQLKIFEISVLTGEITPRFAFVDFTSVEHATAALIHPKNHQLDGRKLVVEYASADAVRRGGGAGHKPRKMSAEGHTEGRSRSRRRDSLGGDKANEKANDLEPVTTNSRPQKEKSTAAGRGNDTSAKLKGYTRKSRPAPGAALALAKREQVAIVPSQGRRITFDDN